MNCLILYLRKWHESGRRSNRCVECWSEGCWSARIRISVAADLGELYFIVIGQPICLPVLSIALNDCRGSLSVGDRLKEFPISRIQLALGSTKLSESRKTSSSSLLSAGRFPRKDSESFVDSGTKFLERRRW